MIIAMDRETLIEELDRLLDVGEPLLAVFPQRYPGVWRLRLPGNISPEMWGYADHVARRECYRERYQDYRRQDTTDYLAGLVKQCESGLLGWRAIGVLG